MKYLMFRIFHVKSKSENKRDIKKGEMIDVSILFLKSLYSFSSNDV